MLREERVNSNFFQVRQRLISLNHYRARYHLTKQHPLALSYPMLCLRPLSAQTCRRPPLASFAPSRETWTKRPPAFDEPRRGGGAAPRRAACDAGLPLGGPLLLHERRDGLPVAAAARLARRGAFQLHLPAVLTHLGKRAGGS